MTTISEPIHGKRKGLSPELEAKHLARQCCRDIKIDHTPEGRIRALHSVGKCLNNPAVALPRVESYGEDLVGVFCQEWGKAGGFPLGQSTAKYARMFAKAFSVSLLERALKAGIGWTALRQLSRKEVTRVRRVAIVKKVRQGALKPTGVVAEVLSIPGISVSTHSPGAAHVESVIKTVTIRFKALQKSLDRLNAAIDAVVEEGDAEIVAKVRNGIAEVKPVARQCNSAWKQATAE